MGNFADMCWQTLPDDWWNCQGPHQTSCTHMKEQCVNMGRFGGQVYWITKGTYEGVGVYMFAMPLASALILPPSAFLPALRVTRRENNAPPTSLDEFLCGPAPASLRIRKK